MQVVVFNIVWEVGPDYAGEVAFASEMCVEASKVQIYPKTFVHDCKSDVSTFEVKEMAMKQ